MAEVTNISEALKGFYEEVLTFLPNPFGDFFSLLLLVFIIFAYAFFIWKFYKFISQRDIIKLDLNKYNQTSNPFMAKFLASIFYFVEYIIILPFIIFFWFTIFTLFLLLLTENLEIGSILVISAAVIASVRMASYYKESLAEDLSKLFPFTLLGISLINPNFFDIERIISNLAQIPTLLGDIKIYLLFVIILEIFLRFLNFIFSLFGLEYEDENKEPTRNGE